MEIVLRKWRPEDIEDVFFYANNEKISDNLRNAFPYPYLQKDAQEFVLSCVNDDEVRQCCRAIVLNGRAAGSIGFFLKDDVYCKSAELGYWLGEPFWGQGIISEAISRMCDLAFYDYGLLRVFAEPFAHNAGSRRALEKAGFQLEGVFRKSIFKKGLLADSCMYARLAPGLE